MMFDAELNRKRTLYPTEKKNKNKNRHEVRLMVYSRRPQDENSF